MRVLFKRMEVGVQLWLHPNESRPEQFARLYLRQQRGSVAIPEGEWSSCRDKVLHPGASDTAKLPRSEAAVVQLPYDLTRTAVPTNH